MGSHPLAAIENRGQQIRKRMTTLVFLQKRTRATAITAATAATAVAEARFTKAVLLKIGLLVVILR